MAATFEQLDTQGVLAILDLAPAMIRDLDGRIIYWTTGAETLYGWNASEAVGRVSHELLQTRFPQPLDEIEARLLQTGLWQGSLQHVGKAGNRIRVASHWALQRDHAGRPAAIAEVNTDVGLREEAEIAQSRLAAIVESSTSAIIGKTLGGVITDWNRAAEHLLGYERAEIVGKHISLLYAEDEEIPETRIIEQLREGKTVEAFETSRVHKSGARIPVSLTVSPIADREGVVIGAASIMRDLRPRIIIMK